MENIWNKVVTEYESAKSSIARTFVEPYKNAVRQSQRNFDARNNPDGVDEQLAEEHANAAGDRSQAVVEGMIDSAVEGATTKGFGVAAKGTGSYKQVKGHHVHAKAAFKENLSYDPKKGFSISQSFMKENGLDHAAMTKYQRQAFKALSQSGGANTMKAHTRIAVEALQAGGASKEMARSLTAQSLNALRNSGVRSPSNIPWYK